MRATATSDSGKLHACVIAGTRAILIALNMSDQDRRGLLGFAFQRKAGDGPFEYLKGMKVFPSLAPKGDDNRIQYFTTDKNPIQSFLWSDYDVDPDTTYEFKVSSMYGKPGSLQPGDTAEFKVTTEKADDGQHGIWFNRGAIASQRFAAAFGNKSLTDAEYNDPTNKEVAWLSRGLLEAFLQYVSDAANGDALRVCAYEFTYQVVLKALKDALDRGVDVQIVYHATPANKKSVQTAGFPSRYKGKQILFERTRPKTPHNKFIVRLANGTRPISVWTGSTNFTASGFLGQTNVGHLVTDGTVASTYLKLWTELSKNPESGEAHASAMALSPNPKNLIDKGITVVFSPRPSDRMLDWYGERIGDAVNSSMFTGAFGVDPEILKPMEQHGPSMRFVLLERSPTQEIIKAQAENSADLMLSYGAILGKEKNPFQKETGHDEDGKAVGKWVPIPHFAIERWFLDEELERRSGDGFVFFIHTKFLLVDPLSNDPLVCTGSANFSGASLKSNDENMLQIRGNTRVADIYATEFDRIFRHFYSRDAANAIAKKGRATHFGLLEESDHWSDEYFDPKNAKDHRREMFFADPDVPWTKNAPKDADVFAGEGKRGSGRSKKPAAHSSDRGRSKTAPARRGHGATAKRASTRRKTAKKAVSGARKTKAKRRSL